MKIEHVRADLVELAQRAATAMVADEEHAKKVLERDGTPTAATREYGLIAKRTWRGAGELWFTAQTIQRLPGCADWLQVKSRTEDGVVAMAHRMYLQALTENGTPAHVARRQAVDCTFYISAIVD